MGFTISRSVAPHTGVVSAAFSSCPSHAQDRYASILINTAAHAGCIMAHILLMLYVQNRKLLKIQVTYKAVQCLNTSCVDTNGRQKTAAAALQRSAFTTHKC